METIYQFWWQPPWQQTRAARLSPSAPHHPAARSRAPPSKRRSCQHYNEWHIALQGVTEELGELGLEHELEPGPETGEFPLPVEHCERVRLVGTVGVHCLPFGPRISVYGLVSGSWTGVLIVPCLGPVGQVRLWSILSRRHQKH